MTQVVRDTACLVPAHPNFGEWTQWFIQPRGRNKVVAVLEAYFDESGINPTDKVCVLMGLVGTSKKWSQFEAGWKTATNGIVFHAKRFFGRDNKGHRLDEYLGWSDEQAGRHLRRVLGAITSRVGQRTLFPVGAIVDVGAFNAFSKIDRMLLTGSVVGRRVGAKKFRMLASGAPSRPYFAALAHCVAASAKLARGNAVVDFVFDQNDTYAPLALQQYQWVLKHGPADFQKRLGTLSFRPDTTTGGLQAADLAAYCFYRRWCGDTNGKPELETAIRELGDAFHGSDGKLAIIDKRSMTKFLADPSMVRARRELGSA